MVLCNRYRVDMLHAEMELGEASTKCASAVEESTTGCSISTSVVSSDTTEADIRDTSPALIHVSRKHVTSQILPFCKKKIFQIN